MKNDIVLRALGETDLEMVRGWRNSPEVADYMYTSEQITEEMQIRWFNKISNDPSSKYWIIEYDSKPLGVASLSDISPLFQSCMWAFYLGDQSTRGAGIGAKVEYNVISHVFDELQLNKLRCEVFTSNEKVIQMHEKYGFRREAYYRQHLRKNGQFKDVVGLALLKSEWQVIEGTIKKKIYGE